MESFMWSIKRYLLPSLVSASAILSQAADPKKKSKGISKVAETVTDQLEAVAKLVVAIAYVAGLMFLLAGFFKLKQHKDNPTQVPVGTPLVLIAIGAAMLFLPGLVKVGGETLDMDTDEDQAGFSFDPDASKP